MAEANNDKISKQSFKYIAQCCGLNLALNMLGQFIAEQFGVREQYLVPLFVAAAFCIITGCVIGSIWKWVAKNSEDMLTTFYSATNAFRMLLALATLTCCYFIAGSENIKVYVLVFMAFYLIAIGHHAAYFARITNNK